MKEYAKFDHLRANAEFLDWFIKDYRDNALANYEWRAYTPQTDCNANQCVQRIEYVGENEKKNVVGETASVWGVLMKKPVKKKF